MFMTGILCTVCGALDFLSCIIFIFRVIVLVIRSVSDVLRAQSRLVKFVGGEAAGRTPYTFY